MREHRDIEDTIDKHGDTVLRVCNLYFRKGDDVQDAFQDTFLKYALHNGTFTDTTHRKAWLIRVATTVCKDILKAAHRRDLPFDEAEPQMFKADSQETPLSEILQAMRTLPDGLRESMYLSLYEGYTAPEVAEILGAPVNTVYTWIARGKKQLKEVLS